MSVRNLVTVALIVFGGFFLACAKPSSPPPPVENPGHREPYIIGIPDVLRVTVWKNPELSAEVPVRSDGMISVPLLDDIQAEGLSPEELKEVIAQSLSEYISTPDVTVIVRRPDSQTATVVGALLRSGTVPLNRETRVLDAIAFLGGFNIWAKKSDIRILRPTADGMFNYRFNYDAFLAGKAPGTNIVLQPGDTVVVPD